MLKHIFSFPLPKIAVAVCLGIVFGEFNSIDSRFPFVFAIISSIFLLLGATFFRGNHVKSLLIYLLCFFLFAYIHHQRKTPIDQKIAEAEQCVLKILSIKKSEKSYHGFAEIQGYIHNDSLFRSKAKGYYFSQDSLEKGKTYWAESRISRPKENSFGEFLRSISVSYMLNIKQPTELQKTSINTFSLLESLQQKVDKYIPKKVPNAIYKAMILGDKSHMTKEMAQRFSTSGTSHILAVSGLHVGVIYLIIIWALNQIRLSFRRFTLFKTLFCIGCIWTYASLTGFGEPVKRASVMFSFMALGGIYRSKISSFNLLFGVLVLLLAYNSASLFKVGFQFSFIAVFGIMYIHSLINNPFKNKIASSLLGGLTVCLSAQVFLFPLILFYFKTFPTYFIFPNLFISFLVFPVMVLGVGFALFSAVSPLAQVFAFLVEKLIDLIYLTASFFSALPHASLHFSLENKGLILMYYGLLLSGIEGVCWYRNRNFQTL